MTQESAQIDAEIPALTDQCQEIKNQMEVRLILIRREIIEKHMTFF